MSKQSKRMQKVMHVVGERKQRSCSDALELMKQCPAVKFDQTVEVALRLGVNPKQSDQQVRGTVLLPHGTGKSVTILVFTKGEKVKEALEAGADYAGSDEYIEKIKGGWVDFSVVIATPDMMREVGKLGKVLGPRGLMPTPKGGTVTNDVASAIKEFKRGKIEFKVDRYGVINVGVGKLSFATEKVVENVQALLEALSRAKPSAAKGTYFRSLFLSSTMGPGISVNLQQLVTT